MANGQHKLGTHRPRDAGCKGAPAGQQKGEGNRTREVTRQSKRGKLPITLETAQVYGHNSTRSPFNAPAPAEALKLLKPGLGGC